MREGVLGIITRKEFDTVILVKRRDVPIWVLPGGGVDEGESPEDAVVREIFEETGLRAQIKRKTGVYTPINRLASLTHVYECEAVGGLLQVTEEAREVKEFKLDCLPKGLLAVHGCWLNDAKLKLEGPLYRPISEITYWALLKFSCLHPALILRAILARIGFPINTP